MRNSEDVLQEMPSDGSLGEVHALYACGSEFDHQNPPEKALVILALGEEAMGHLYVMLADAQS